MADDPNPQQDPAKTDPPATDPPKADPPAWTPPSKADYEATLAKLKDANAESAARRKKIDELTKAQENDAEKKVREAVDAARAETKPAVVAAVAKSALLEADGRADRIGTLVKLIDLSKVDIDGDKITGLDDEVKRVKAEAPELFKTEDGGKKTPKINPGGGGKAPADGPRTIGERIAAARQQ